MQLSLADFHDRLLVVLGATTQSDLESLYEVLEDRLVSKLHVLLVWPPESPEPTPPVTPAAQFTIFRGDANALAQGLREQGAPSAKQLPTWGIRVRTQTVELSAREVERIVGRFALLTEQQLVPPESFTMEDLKAFLQGSLENLSGFHAGLPFPRSFTSDEGLGLQGELQRALRSLDTSSEGLRTLVFRCPAQGGAGSTTLMRSAVIELAKMGVPSLILKPEQVDIDIEEILAFATALSEKALGQNIDDLPPLTIMFDVEHLNIQRLRQLAQMMAAHGRKALIIQIVPWDGTEPVEKRSTRYIRLKPMRALAEAEEIRNCAIHFESLVRRWNLPITAPTEGHWNAYNDSQARWHTPDVAAASASLFWVALRFFLTEGLDLSDRESTQDALGSWITKRIQKVQNPQMLELLGYTAALSVCRMIAPLWTVLRPVTGGAYTTAVKDLLISIEDLVAWGAFSQDVDDYTIRFFHPAVAQEYLRQQGVADFPAQIQSLAPMITGLSAGHPGDIWVLEMLAATALTPPYDERRFADWEWRLAIFERMPPTIREQSKTILHHWARCLYLSVDSQNALLIASGDGRSRLLTAIQKLKKAIELPKRRGRDEHPSHLYNTLGTAYYRLATLLEQSDGASQGEGANDAWEHACSAFQRSIELLPGGNIEALLAFSRRLLTHATATQEKQDGITEQQVLDVARALSLLDEADELAEQLESIEPNVRDQIIQDRAKGRAWLDKADGRAYIQELQSGLNPELGFYCEARLALSDQINEQGIDAALAVLERGDSLGIPPTGRGIAFRLSLLRRHRSKCYDFGAMRQLYRSAEGLADYTLSPIDAFRHAVICYQVGDYEEGASRFRRLRESARRQEITPTRIRDLLRDKDNPDKARVTQIRILRLTTEWRAEGYVDEMRQTVPLRPRHFSPPPTEKEVVNCVIRFEYNGPLAVPPRFVGM